MIQRGYDLIKRFEGFSTTQYWCAAGVPTIGWGTTRWWDGKPIPEGGIVTVEEAEKLFRRDVTFFEVRTRMLVRRVRLPKESFAALVSFSYNLGIGALAGSTLLKKVRREDFDAATDQFKRWVHAGGRRLEGLVIRRKIESRLFMEGVVDMWLDQLEQDG